MSDKMILTGIEVYGHHGCTVEERRIGQKFIVDLEIDLDLSDACLMDDLDETVDYGKILECVENIVSGKAYNLIESLAEEIANEVIHIISIESHVTVEGVKVRVHKPHSPLKFHCKDIAVEIYRT